VSENDRFCICVHACVCMCVHVCVSVRACVWESEQYVSLVIL